ncbi:hypothetical protein DdX_16254 [Ditylenchus destructor]|uniref:Uncharacterized protein n=1 Tax=Ditylenchus destructor TaxID=166010 RepID=A0AAD4MPA9_9BILA|nr:hypothetical protein DdX_16254 [Ditylenchus destructor]
MGRYTRSILYKPQITYNAQPVSCHFRDGGHCDSGCPRYIATKVDERTTEIVFRLLSPNASQCDHSTEPTQTGKLDENVDGLRRANSD